MRNLRGQLTHALLGIVGVVFGLLSTIGLALAAVVPPILGLLAVVTSPFRVLLDRVRGGRRR